MTDRIRSAYRPAATVAGARPFAVFGHVGTDGTGPWQSTSTANSMQCLENRKHTPPLRTRPM